MPRFRYPAPFAMTSATLRSLRTVLVLAFALTAAAVCTRLGFWQVSRLKAKQSHNRILTARLADSVVDFRHLPPDTAAGHYRLVRVAGVPDYTRELAWAPRMRRGSPGVNFLTPVRMAGTDTLVLVNRGWAYSPDARSVEFARWRERDTIAVSGYVETWGQQCAVADAPLPPGCADSTTRFLRRLDRSAVERIVGAPVAPYLVMQTSDSTLHADSIPVRVEMPILDEGPHRGYAYQWFGIAIVMLAGGTGLAMRERRR